jgi:hypothetical protein
MLNRRDRLATGPCPLPATASAARRSVSSVTAAYRLIIRSLFQPPSAMTMGAVKPALRANTQVPQGALGFRSPAEYRP